MTSGGDDPIIQPDSGFDDVDISLDLDQPKPKVADRDTSPRGNSGPPRGHPREYEVDQDAEGWKAAADYSIAVLGDRESGKTFLFHAMAHLCSDYKRSGALTPFLRQAPRLYKSNTIKENPSPIEIEDFLGEYRDFLPLPTNLVGEAPRFILRLMAKGGFLGGRPVPFDVEMVDAAGEAMRRKPLPPHLKPVFEATYAQAGVVILCVPTWVFFPAAGYRAEARESLSNIHNVLSNLEVHREKAGKTAIPILCLTMADDQQRSTESNLRDVWIDALQKSWERYDAHQKSVRGLGGASRYFQDALKLSNVLYDAIENTEVRKVSVLLQRLEKICYPRGRGQQRAWVVATSAVQGRFLEAGLEPETDSERPPEPRPVHVELPLLIALNELRPFLQ